MLIYGITRNNKVVYVGQTIRKLRDRIYGHKKDMRTKDTILARAFKKYGFDKFKFVILVNDIKSFKELDKMERKMIKKFKTFPCGSGKYNITSGGRHHLDQSPEYIEKLRNAQLRRYENPDERKRTGEIMKQAYKEHPEMSENKREKNKQRYKNINERIKTGKAMKAAYDRDPTIKQKIAKATRQRYIDDPSLRKKQSILSKTDIRYIRGRENAHKAVRKQIICAETGKIFPSIQSAANLLKVAAPSVSKALRKKSCCRGFHFFYKEDGHGKNE